MILPYIKKNEVSIELKPDQITGEDADDEISKLNLPKELETKAVENKDKNDTRDAWEKIAKQK
jgi:hypothetical protein